MAQNQSTAVMNRRAEPTDSLDFFPTPPWATRALLESSSVIFPVHPVGYPITAWEPACGEGHMAEVLNEHFAAVHASDIHDYGRDYAVGDFTSALDPARCPFRPDWIITNPPFNHAAAFLDRALAEAAVGVALLLRTSWLEGGERFREIFRDRRPAYVLVFSERVPMVKGRWDPDGSTATSYAWFVWYTRSPAEPTILDWIPPGQRERLTRPDDAARFAAPDVAGSLPLFSDEGAGP